MAESGAGESFGSILQNWSNIGNIFAAFVIAGVYPFVKYFGRKYTKWKDAKDADEARRDKEAIIEIAKEVQQPINDRMTKVEEILEKSIQQNATMLDHMNIIEQLLQSGRISFQKGPGRPSKHYDHSSGDGDKSGYHPNQRRS